MNAAFLGRHPLTYEDGSPYPAELAGETLTADGKRFVLWGIAGDTDFFVNDLHMFHWQNEHMCLGRCLASRTAGPLLYSDFRPVHSQWMENRLSASYIKNNHLANHRHPWFDVHGSSALVLHYDEMHVCAQHGILAHALANVIFDIVFLQLKGNHIRALNIVWERINAFYVEANSPHRIGRLTIDMFSNSSKPLQVFPMLSTAIKAAETRYLLPIIYKLSLEYNVGEPHHDQRDAMLNYLMTFYRFMDESPIVPSAEAGSRMFGNMHKFLLTYQSLSSWAVEHGHMMYATTSKFHHAFHLAEQARATLCHASFGCMFAQRVPLQCRPRRWMRFHYVIHVS